MTPSHKTFLLCSLWLLCISWTNGIDFMSTNMREDLRKLKAHFRTSDKNLFQDPVFLKKLDDLESQFGEGEQKLLLGEILDVYNTILADMERHLKDKPLKQSISAVAGKIMELKNSYFQDKRGLLKAQLQDTWSIKTHDLLVQRKALAELAMVYHKASLLGSKLQRKREMSRRRRRQSSRT